MNRNATILGAIAGDFIGSIYEHVEHKDVSFSLFIPGQQITDDSVMTIAVADWLMSDSSHSHNSLVEKLQHYGRRYPYAGYGGSFRRWLRSDNPQPYNSWGNGSAMRVSPVGFVFETLEETLRIAQVSAEVTHNHPEGIKGAQATAGAIFLARTGKSKKEIKDWAEKNFSYDLHRTIEQLRPSYSFDVSCQGSVPESIISFLEGNDYEHCVRLAISLGGDADTMACIAGGIAAAYYGGVPENITEHVMANLPKDLRDIINKFENLL